MVGMRLNINTQATVKFTNILEKLHRSALPVAVRSALNDAAFDVKTRTMPDSAKKEFTQRQKNFFKANSSFEKATGFSIRNMKATVGFQEHKLQKRSSNYAVKDLVQQEYGGKIARKSFIPMRAARVAGRGVTKAAFRKSQISRQGIINAAKVRSVSGRHRKQRFIRAAIKARELHGDNAFILGNLTRGSQTLFKVVELWTGTRNHRGFASFGSRKLRIKLVPLYRFKRGRAVSVARTGFMKRASLGTAVRLEDFYIAQAHRQLNKYYGRL